MKSFVLIVTLLLLSGCAKFEPTVLTYDQLEIENKRKPIDYAVYTPPNWRTDEQLPLILFLHGGGGSHESFERFGAHTELDRLISEGKVERAIIALPNGDVGFWENWADGSRHYRDWVLQNVMPKVQQDYNTLGCPEHCHLVGISMGGFGALRMANFHPDLFSSVSAISAPIFSRPDQRPSLLLRLLIPFKRIFGDIDSGEVLGTNPYYAWVDKRLDQKMRLQLVWGDQDNEGIVMANQDFTKHLSDNRVDHQTLVYEGGHKWKYWVPIFEEVMVFTLGVPQESVSAAP